VEPAIIDDLAESSKLRTISVREELTARLDVALPAEVRENICIYATGSLARLEASSFSDLDAFFYILGSRNTHKIEPVNEIIAFNHVIETAKAVDFPDFSGGGEYLHFQYLEDVIDNIGSREDDYINGLTSRMLLILESSYLYNEPKFVLAREKVIERYFVDFPDHSAAFRPIFILNDVLRFWRTLCLNYEHGREWQNEDQRERAKGHLKNLKLRFSRLLICYSFVGALLQEGPALNAEQVIEIASKTPIQRLRSIRDGNEALNLHIDAALSEYGWFLSKMSADKDDVLDWIGDDACRLDAFNRSTCFIEAMYKVVTGVAEQHGYMRYLVI
jgi:hypothetical protein